MPRNCTDVSWEEQTDGLCRLRVKWKNIICCGQCNGRSANENRVDLSGTDVELLSIRLSYLLKAHIHTQDQVSVRTDKSLVQQVGMEMSSWLWRIVHRP